MGEASPGTPPSVRSSEDRLDSWKEIAAYLSRDVTTVQRWEKREGMPIHRHLHDRMGSVYASRSELDAWARSRNLPPAQESGPDAPSPSHPALPPRSAISTFLTKWTLALAAAAVALAIGASLWFQRTEYFWRNPIADARFQTVTDFDGMEHAAAVSRDGQFVAFLSDRDGQMDVWITQVGSGQLHNLTRGSMAELPNPAVRNLGQHWADSRGHTWKEWPSSTGRAMAPDSRTTRLDRETRSSFQRAAGDRTLRPFSLRLPDSTATFRCGRRTRHLSTSCKAPFQTSWTSGASLQLAGTLNGSRRTMDA